MTINRSQFFKTLGLGTAFHILESNFQKVPSAGNQSIVQGSSPLPNIKYESIKPKALQPGDTIGLVSPASPVYNPEDFEEMLVKVNSLGYKVVLGEHVRDRRGYLAGTDEDLSLIHISEPTRR